MSLEKLIEKVNNGQRLIDLKSRVEELLNQLEMCKNDLETMLATANADSSYTDDDKADIQEAITFLTTEIKNRFISE